MVDLASDFLDRNTPVFRFCIYFDEEKPKTNVQNNFDDYKLPGTMFASSSVSQEKRLILSELSGNSPMNRNRVQHIESSLLGIANPGEPSLLESPTR